MNAAMRAESSSVRGVMVCSMAPSSSRDEPAHAGELGEMGSASPNKVSMTVTRLK